jgi:hypothetical protein
VLFYREPVGQGVRVDAGIAAGQTITVHYDPLLAKLITHGESREAAVSAMTTALREYDILGLPHNISFLLALIGRPEVRGNRAHTRFIEEHLTSFPRRLGESHARGGSHGGHRRGSGCEPVAVAESAASMTLGPIGPCPGDPHARTTAVGSATPRGRRYPATVALQPGEAGLRCAATPGVAREHRRARCGRAIAAGDTVWSPST